MQLSDAVIKFRSSSASTFNPCEEDIYTAILLGLTQFYKILKSIIVLLSFSNNKNYFYSYYYNRSRPRSFLFTIITNKSKSLSLCNGIRYLVTNAVIPLFTIVAANPICSFRM